MRRVRKLPAACSFDDEELGMQGSRILKLTGIVLVAALSLSRAQAQAIQTTGKPCEPSATTTVDGKYLPSPPAPFGGEINLDAKNSKPCWPAQVVPPKGAPNILLIMTDIKLGPEQLKAEDQKAKQQAIANANN
jgi:hypothetical protein